MNDSQTLLSVRDLRTCFQTEDGLVKAVDGVSFTVEAGKTFALVGESGCGKSVTAFSILRLLQCPPARIEAAGIEFQGTDLLSLSERQMRGVRGGSIGMIFQEPMNSLNPVLTCGYQIVEAIQLHKPMPQSKAKEAAIDMLRQVGIPDERRRFAEYPHQMSGGMKQRVMIAMALSCDPELLIADEPTTALDVTIQGQILDLLREIQESKNLSIMLITHDLAVVAESSDTVAVMYASKIVETTDTPRLLTRPLHPYTQGLLRSAPRLGERAARLETIAGSVPNPLNFPSGCKFHPRCPIGKNLAQCRDSQPPLREVEPGHMVACWKCPGYENAESDK